MKKGSKIILSAVLLTGLAGCAGDNDNAGDMGIRNNNGNNVQTRNVGNNGNGNDDKVRISNKLERNVEKMGEVDDANVIVSNNDAYVAVRLKNNGNGNKNGNNGGDNNANGDNNGNPLGIRNNDGTGDANDNGIGNGYGLGNGAGYNTDGTGRVIGANDGDAGVGDNNLGDMNIGNNNNNGNNGASGNDGGEYSRVSTAFEQKVADQIRKVDRNINNVYVSTSPDVYNNMTDYAEGLRGGNNNGEGLFEDFNDAVGRFFGRNK
ncbi:hypothetical protein CVD28_20325 [Bacillus sp. M6-12]|uniref:YhcN/YlaJ family sporulation lipoprotein n=1 Tax=Bacillus sp. M6-12 TaxID=2054166 RepID=UPI000C78D068|nr:YhcN/YlaJ family sporulation lipoprotein [Bacillus sp. M6-12]PLS15851.1 hypothetical protein CVD28_20325 [Bacillus sp. M6-12]